MPLDANSGDHQRPARYEPAAVSTRYRLHAAAEVIPGW